MSIPLIDFSQLSPAQESFHQSLKDIGFSKIINFGVEPALMAEAFAISKQFFAQSPEFKAQFAYQSAEENFGYQGLMEENLDPSAPADLKETFTMRNPDNYANEAGRWPSPEFENCMRRFYHDALAAALRLQTVVAKQFGLADDFFTKVHKGENIALRLLYYPAISNALSEGQLGAGAHTDYGFMTLLFQDQVSGLQVQDSNDQWLDVRPTANAAVINCGDLLEIWSNGHYRSTLHRVKPMTTGQERLSIALFMDPDSSTWVEPITQAPEPARFQAVNAGEHIAAKLNLSHQERFQP